MTSCVSSRRSSQLSQSPSFRKSLNDKDSRLSMPITQFQPNLPELNADVNALNIVAVVDAFMELDYVFNGPCPIPIGLYNVHGGVSSFQ